MLEKLFGNYFLNILNCFFYVLVLQMLLSLYMQLFNILYISLTIYLVAW